MSLARKINFTDYRTAPIQNLNPYADNKGNVVAIAETDYIVTGADTRLNASLQRILVTKGIFFSS